MVESRYQDDEQIREDAQKILEFIDQETEVKSEKDVDLLLQACMNRKRNSPQPQGQRGRAPKTGGLDYVK
ncbi:MAG: hypothetical protein ABEK04_06325 [Candidatus Nanohalobium sp.]